MQSSTWTLIVTQKGKVKHPQSKSHALYVAADARDNLGSTPLFYAKDTAVAKVLLQAGANVNAQDDHGMDTAAICRYLHLGRDGPLLHTQRPGNSVLHQLVKRRTYRVARLQESYKLLLELIIASGNLFQH